MSVFDHDARHSGNQVRDHAKHFGFAGAVDPSAHSSGEGQVNIDDVLNNETGAIIRMRAPGMVQPFSSPFVGQPHSPCWTTWTQMREDRTGMSKAAMGLDPDALQSTTKAAVSATVSASQSRAA
jgi:hypothetical protein